MACGQHTTHRICSQSALGEAISVDQKDYYCIEIGLPGAPKGPTTELFMLDTAATSSLLTPKASQRLGGSALDMRKQEQLVCEDHVLVVWILSGRMLLLAISPALSLFLFT